MHGWKGVWAESGTWVTSVPTLPGTEGLPPESNSVGSALYSFAKPHQNMAIGFNIVLGRKVSGLLNLVYILGPLMVKRSISYVCIVLKA